MENAESSSPHDDAANDPLSQALERWFSALDEGREPSLLEAAGGDAALATELGATLGRNTATIDRLSAPVDGAAPDREGQKFGDFTLLATIGEGASGKVYLARQESLGRLCAVKVLNLAAAGRHDARVRFRREAEIAARLSHRAVVPIYAVGERDGLPFIAMKWLTGPPLDALETPPEPREVARLGAIVARGLHEAHLAGVVHRDVKPANVLLDDGEPVIVDFGLARAADDATLTRADIVPGTLAYVAPELLAREITAADPRTDVYSLGATLYEVATGLPPFVAESSAEMIAAVLHGSPPPPRMDGDRDFVTILLRALDRDPRRRFASCAELADDLERFVRDEPILSRRPGPLERAWRKLRRRPRTAAAVVLTLMAGSVAGARIAFDAAQAREDRRRTIREAELAIATGELARAESAIRGPLARWSGDPEVVELARRARFEAAFGQLVDAVLESAASRSAFEKLPHEDRLLAEAATDAERRAAALATAIASAVRGSFEAAAKLIDGMPPIEAGGEDPVAEVFRVLLAEKPPSDLKRAFGAPSREVMLTAVALNAYGYREEAREAGETIPATHPDKLWARAISALEGVSTDDAGVARRALEAFDRTKRAPRAILRALVWVALAHGERERADNLLRELGDDPADVSTAMLRNDFEFRFGDPARARAQVAELLAAHAENPNLLLRAAESAAMSGDLDRAEALLGRAAPPRPGPGIALRVELAKLSIRCARLQASGGGEGRERALEELVVRARAAATSRSIAKRSLAAARWLEAVGLKELGRDRDARAALQEAQQADADEPRALVSSAAWSYDDAQVAAPAEKKRLLEAARDAAGRVLAAQTRGGLALGRADLRTAGAVRFFALLDLEESEAARTAGAAWLAEYGDDADPKGAEYAEAIAQSLSELEP